MKSEPRFLVQTADGYLHGYWNLDILLVDLAANKTESVKLYVLTDGLKVRYAPTSADALREMAA
jgi:hypothetical protein